MAGRPPREDDRAIAGEAAGWRPETEAARALGWSDPATGAVVGPNPLTQGQSVAQLYLPSATAGTQVTARLYNLAGELIMTATNDLDPKRLYFDVGKRQVSGGVYVMAVTAKAPWGQVERKTYKLVVVR